MVLHTYLPGAIGDQERWLRGWAFWHCTPAGGPGFERPNGRLGWAIFALGRSMVRCCPPLPLKKMNIKNKNRKWVLPICAAVVTLTYKVLCTWPTMSKITTVKKLLKSSSPIFLIWEKINCGTCNGLHISFVLFDMKNDNVYNFTGSNKFYFTRILSRLTS